MVESPCNAARGGTISRHRQSGKDEARGAAGCSACSPAYGGIDPAGAKAGCCDAVRPPRSDWRDQMMSLQSEETEGRQDGETGRLDPATGFPVSDFETMGTILRRGAGLGTLPPLFQKV